jgi:hypothetical protein
MVDVVIEKIGMRVFSMDYVRRVIGGYVLEKAVIAD